MKMKNIKVININQHLLMNFIGLHEYSSSDGKQKALKVHPTQKNVPEVVIINEDAS